MSEDRPFLDEDVTRARWRCVSFAIVEYCEESDVGTNPARSRLLKRIQTIAPKIEGSKLKPVIEYREGS